MVATPLILPLAARGDPGPQKPPLPEPCPTGTGSPLASPARGLPPGGSCYDRLGGFDEVFARAKDENMFWRFRQAGLRAAVSLDVVVHHHGSRIVREERPRAPAFETVNKRCFDRKWCGACGRLKGWKLRLAARHLLGQFRGGPIYEEPVPRARRARDGRSRAAQATDRTATAPGRTREGARSR